MFNICMEMLCILHRQGQYMQTHATIWLGSGNYAGWKPGRMGACILFVGDRHNGNIPLWILTLRVLLFSIWRLIDKGGEACYWFSVFVFTQGYQAMPSCVATLQLSGALALWGLQGLTGRCLPKTPAPTHLLLQSLKCLLLTCRAAWLLCFCFSLCVS